MLRPIGNSPYFLPANYLDQRPRRPDAEIQNPFAAQTRLSATGSTGLGGINTLSANSILTRRDEPTPTTRPQRQPAETHGRNPIAGHPRNWPKVWPGDAVPPIKENQLNDKQSQEFLKELNAYRAKYGLKPVKLNKALCEAADKHSLYQTRLNSCNHYGPPGTMHWFSGRSRAAGYTGQPVAENVAAGQNSVKEILWAWHMSPGHRRAMLDPKISEIGIGFRRGKKGPYGGERWTFVSGRGGQSNTDPDENPRRHK